MTCRYTSTLDIITLLEDVKTVVRDNDHKINKLMLSADNPNFKGFWAIVEPQVFNKKHLNYRGVKVLIYKLMICLINDVNQPVPAYPDYDDEFYEEPEQAFIQFLIASLRMNLKKTIKMILKMNLLTSLNKIVLIVISKMQ